VTFTLRSMPRGAEVFGPDGRRLGRTPLGISLDQGPGDMTYVLRSPGYANATVTLPTQENAERDVTLVPRRPPVRRGPREPLDPFNR
jgi:hypothetical protein